MQILSQLLDVQAQAPAVSKGVMKRMLATAAERPHTRHFLSAVTFAQPPSAVTLRYSLYRSSSLPPMRGI